MTTAEYRQAAKDGSYFLVVDAYPVGKNKTRVDVYRRTKVGVLVEAIKGWVEYPGGLGIRLDEDRGGVRYPPGERPL